MMAPQCPLDSLSKDEREHFHTLSMEDAYTWVEMKRRQVRQLLYSLDAIHNLFPPVNRLPNEIFLEIVGYVKTPDGMRHLPWLTLAGVCRDWRETILATPMLWTTINISHNSSFVRLCLKRSQNALISIHDGRRRSTNTKASVKALLPHINRVLSLEAIHLDNTMMKFLTSKLTVDMPHLERLSLGLADTRTSRAILSHSFSRLPHLRSLTFYNVQVPWSSPMLVGLSELDLSFDTLGVPALPLETLLDILEASPHLTLLRMKNCQRTVSTEAEALTSPVRVVRLPELKTLKLAEHQAGISFLLAHLVLPADILIDLCPSYTLDGDDWFPVHPILDIFPCTPPSLADVACVSLYVTDDILFLLEASVFSDAKQSVRLRIELDYPEALFQESVFAPAICDTAALLSSAPLQRVKIHGFQDLVNFEHWDDTLSRLTCVEELEIGIWGDVCLFWTVLGLSQDDGEFYCPRLEKLVIVDIELDEKTALLVIECLQDRMLNGHRLKTLEYCCEEALPIDYRHTIETLVDSFHNKIGV